MSGSSQPTLSVYHGKRLVFWSYGKWLYPLLELEEYLSSAGAVAPAELAVQDRMVGKAAALLTLRLGIREVYGETMSSLGKGALEAAGAKVGFGKLVDRILCATEELLLEVEDPNEAHRLVLGRIQSHNNDSS